MAGNSSPVGTQMLPYVAALSGVNEVPPVATTGQGTSLLGFDSALTSLRVVLAVSNLRGTTVAHIHTGRPGENGPIVLFLFGPTRGVNIGPSTILTNRTFTAADLTGPLAGMPLSVLAQQIMAGNAYVNVHTLAHPNGEIRGQIVLRP